MSTPLDTILSRGGEAAPEQDRTEDQVTPDVKTVEKDEGAFVATTSDQQADGQSAESDGDGNRIPVAALQAERQKVKRYTEEVAEFRKANETLQRQMAELMQRIPVPQPQQPKQPTDFFDNPDQAFQDRLQASLGQALGPIEQQMQFNARLVATSMHGKDKTEAALAAFDQAAAAGQMDEATYLKVRRSPNPFHEAVQWHQSQLARQEIGDDPAAYKQKLRDELKAEILAELNGGGQQQTQQRQQVMPTNFQTVRNVGARTGPAWAGPQPVDSIFATHRTRQ